MRRIVVIMLISVFGTSTMAFSQDNLLRNPSFEKYNHLPAYLGDAPGSITDWDFLNANGSGDYFHENAIGIKCRTQDNYMGSEKPHSGIAYAGFCVTSTYREFLCSELITPLEKGKKYKFTMYISKGDHKDISYLKEIGVMFLSRKWLIHNDVEMGLPPQILFYSDTGFTQHQGWQELSYTFIAKGYEKWIYIGAHQWRCDTCKSIPGTARSHNPFIFGGEKEQAHYFVDDVSLVEVKDSISVDTTARFVTGKVYSFSNILFGIDSDELKSSSYAVIDTIVEYLRENPEVKVVITGHTDSTGDWHENLKLSERRAQAVKDDIVYRGKISASRITTIGLGQMKPIASNKTDEGRSANRRVEFLFTTPH